MPNDEAPRLARKLAALPEPAMRAHVLQEYIGGTDPGEVVQVLAAIQVRGRQGGPPFDVALVALATVLNREMLDYELLEDLYREAKEAGLELLLELFLTGKEENAFRDRNDRQRDYTLGHRKWLARDTRRDVLVSLLQDPEVEVIPNLLQNPRIIERDVVLLAARRPVDPKILRCIFDSPRWITRYAVKRALVLNPYSPTSMSIRLLGLMTSRDQRLVRGISNLPQAVQNAAAKLLEQRQAYEERGSRKSERGTQNTESDPASAAESAAAESDQDLDPDSDSDC